jgi:hypothetical protein
MKNSILCNLADLALICLALQQRTKTKAKVTFGIFKRHNTLKRNGLQEVQNLTSCFAGHACCLQVNKLFGPTIVIFTLVLALLEVTAKFRLGLVSKFRLEQRLGSESLAWCRGPILTFSVGFSPKASERYLVLVCMCR